MEWKKVGKATASQAAERLTNASPDVNASGDVEEWRFSAA
jgi:hypothetical protein